MQLYVKLDRSHKHRETEVRLSLPPLDDTPVYGEFADDGRMNAASTTNLGAGSNVSQTRGATLNTSLPIPSLSTSCQPTDDISSDEHKGSAKVPLKEKINKDMEMRYNKDGGPNPGYFMDPYGFCPAASSTSLMSELSFPSSLNMGKFLFSFPSFRAYFSSPPLLPCRDILYFLSSAALGVFVFC